MENNRLFPPEIVEYTIESHFVRFNCVSKYLYLSVILLLLGGIGILPIVSVSITRQGYGTIRTVSENNNLITAIYGQVKENRIYENLAVQEGDTLMILNTKKLDEELETLAEKLVIKQGYLRDLNRLLKGDLLKLETTLFRNDNATHRQKLVELDAEIQKTEKNYEINRKLFEKEVIAMIDFEEFEFRYKQALQSKELYLQQKRLRWQTRLEEIKQEVLELESQHAQLDKEKENYIIKAPVTGCITHYTGIKTGNFLTPNQTLAQISPNGDLMVECYISPSVIGFIRKDMAVVFQFDAFNYNQWGLGYGKVLEISPDIFHVNNNQFFKVRCCLDKDYLELKNGSIGKLKKGMTLTARFQVAKRTLFQLLYDKVDDWLNPNLKN